MLGNVYKPRPGPQLLAHLPLNSPENLAHHKERGENLMINERIKATSDVIVRPSFIKKE
jgi:hypothetical protein